MQFALRLPAIISTMKLNSFGLRNGQGLNFLAYVPNSFYLNGLIIVAYHSIIAEVETFLESTEYFSDIAKRIFVRE